MRRIFRILTLSGVLFAADALSQALFDFYPTEAEWATFPPFCRARYVVSSTGRTSQWAHSFPAEEIERWQSIMGECWGMAHHTCAGMTYLSRSKLEPSPTKKKYTLGRAEDELVYARKYCPAGNPYSANLETTLGMVYAEQGKTGEALASLDRALAQNPDYDGAYIAKSIVLRRQGKAEDGRKVLLRGLETIPDGTAELNYALGLSYFSTKEYEQARQYARQAYAQGYPLPGLRDRLKAVGFPL